jgi:hypothetical protein
VFDQIIDERGPAGAAKIDFGLDDPHRGR